MPDYYVILGVGPNASREEIKEAYRKKLKRLHPDLNNYYDARQFQQLMHAYQVLQSQHLRNARDNNRTAQKRFNYREFLLSHQYEDWASVKLLVYDLIHENLDDAIQMYEKNILFHKIELHKYLSYVDYMDCLFLIGETYEKKKRYLSAYRLFITIVRLEAERPVFHHFVQDIVNKIFKIVCFNLRFTQSEECILRCIEQLRTLQLTKNKREYLSRLASELFLVRKETTLSI